MCVLRLHMIRRTALLRRAAKALLISTQILVYITCTVQQYSWIRTILL